MPNTAEHSANWSTEQDSNYQDELVEKAANLEHTLNLSSEQRTAVWREILTEADSGHDHRAIAAAIFSPFKNTVNHVMPQQNFDDNRAVHYGQQAINSSMNHALQQLENQFRIPNHENPDYDAMAGAVEHTYQHISAITSQYVELLNGKTDTEAKWALAKHGAMDTYLNRYDEFEDKSVHDYWRHKPENFSTIAFINEFPPEQSELFNALIYPAGYEEFPTDRWNDDAVKSADALLIATLYHSAMEQFPMQHDNLAMQRDFDDDYGSPDNNRLRHILTHNITGKFTNEYQTVLSNLHKEEDSEPLPDSISMEFNPPEYQQIQQLITGYFNNRIDDIDDDIRAALDGNNHADLTATIGQLMSLEQETAAMREYSKTDFPPMDSPEERADLDALYDRYREQLLEALFKTANEHVTPERNFYRAFSAIDVNPIGSIDTKIQWDWIEANDPRANPNQESTQQRQE